MTQPSNGIDHVLIATADLDGAAARMRRLGFAVTPRGRHVGWGTANNCIMFGQDYLELLGIIDPTAFCNNLDKRLAEQGEGLLGIAFATKDTVAAQAILNARGVAMQDPKALSRALDLPEGTVMPEFSLLHPVDAAALPAVNGFFTQHLTPELLRRPDWVVHPNSAQAIASVTIVVDEPQTVVEAYEKIFGRASVVPTDEMISVHAGHHVLLFVRPDDALSLYPDLDDLPPLPAMVAMNVKVADLKAARIVLDANEIEYHALPGDTLRIAPDVAGGFVLDLSA